MSAFLIRKTTGKKLQYTLLWATAAAVVLAACGVSSGDPAPVDSVSEALCATGSCSPLVLTATKSKAAERKVQPAAAFLIPATLAVSSGGSATVEAKLELEGPGGVERECKYRRTVAGALNWVSCSGGLAPGQAFTIKEIELSVKVGPSGTTVVAQLQAGGSCLDAGAVDAALDAPKDAVADVAADVAADAKPDAQQDANSDAALDAGADADAKVDAQVDAQLDSAIDSGPSCTAATCNDGNACNGVETCSAQGLCLPGTPPVVDDGNACTADSCSALTGVSHTNLAAGSACADGDVCNGAETCNGAGASQDPAHFDRKNMGYVIRAAYGQRHCARVPRRSAWRSAPEYSDGRHLRASRARPVAFIS
jgi:hypothetical protein